jgi:hypothetical protein
LREKGFGEACSVREILKHEACLLSEFPNLLTDMEFIYLMFDVAGNHKHFIKRFNYRVKAFLLKLKIFLISPKIRAGA